MPYKERIKTGEERKRSKAQYKVTNWSEYNRSLKNRGKISLYFPKGDIESIFINERPYEEGYSGLIFQDKFSSNFVSHYLLF
jgi:hypothetical protein